MSNVMEGDRYQTEDREESDVFCDYINSDLKSDNVVAVENRKTTDINNFEKSDNFDFEVRRSDRSADEASDKKSYQRRRRPSNSNQRRFSNEKRRGRTYAGDTLYISNLVGGIRTDALRSAFAKYGEVEECRVINNPVTKESRGFAFLRFSNKYDADIAMQEMHGTIIQGREISVEMAKRSRPHNRTPGQYKGPSGASIKYDDQGRLKPGFVPFWDLPAPKGGAIPVQSLRKRINPYSPQAHPYTDHSSRVDYYYKDRPRTRDDSRRYVSSYHRPEPAHRHNMRCDDARHHNIYREPRSDFRRDADNGRFMEYRVSSISLSRKSRPLNYCRPERPERRREERVRCYPAQYKDDSASRMEGRMISESNIPYCDDYENHMPYRARCVARNERSRSNRRRPNNRYRTV